jgi:hypothetical protein
MAAKAMHMVSALLLGLPQLGKLAIDGGRPFSRRDGDIPAISASDEIERGERRRNGLNAGEQPLVVLGLLFFQRCDLLVDARAARLYRIDVAHGHGSGAACKHSR